MRPPRPLAAPGRTASLAGLLLATAAFGGIPDARAQDAPVLFDDVTLFDGDRSRGKRDVLIEDGRIVRVARRIRAPEGATIIEGEGSFLMPGLIDAHTHVFSGEGGRDALRFGQATAQARAGRLDEALSLYDALLADDPDNVDAAHNRDIVQALRELGTPDEPERRQDGDGSGELPPDASSGGGGEGESASRESRESGQGGERQDEPQGSDRSAGAGEAVAAEANGGDSAGGDADGRDGSEPGESERARADRRSDGPGGERAAEDGADGESAAREALAAEAARARERDESGTAASEGEADGRAATANGAEAFDEGEQAVRQWLRRIPDDPAGLLRARLRQTHRDDYPEVGDGDEPW